MTMITDEMVAKISKILPAINGHIVRAAADMDAAQQKQPEWAWLNYDAVTAAYGRWPRGEGQAPYIRADLVVIALCRALEAALSTPPAPDGTIPVRVAVAMAPLPGVPGMIEPETLVAFNDGTFWARTVENGVWNRIEGPPSATVEPVQPVGEAI